MARVRKITPDEHALVSELLGRGRDDSGMSKRKEQAALASLQQQKRGHQGGAEAGLCRETYRNRHLFTAGSLVPGIVPGTEDL